MPQDLAPAPLSATEDFTSDLNYRRADETVAEVFASMFGLPVDCVHSQGSADGVETGRTAIVGFSGAMRGCCEIHMDHRASASIASIMLGGLAVDDDDSLNDAVGELCNMVAGGWKDRVPSLSSQCALSPPTVITGTRYKVNLSRPSIRLKRCYAFNGHRLYLTLHREDAAG